MNLDNATDVLTWNGYSSDSKQTLWTFERYKNTPYYYIINNFNGKAMNLSGDGPDDLSGKPIELWKQYDANNEDNSDFLWYFKDTGDGYVNIYNKMTNKALDITNGEDADGVVLQQYAPNGTASQKFKLVNYSQVYFPTREKYANNNIYINSATPVKKGCKFLGWSTSANGNVVYQPGDLYDVNQNGGTVTLYAKWTTWKHTVTYDKNVPANSKKTDVKNMPGNQTKIYDQNLTLQSNVPTRIGYTFVKWTTNKDGTGTAYQPGSQYSYNRDSDGGTVTLYAVWTPWKYTVRYDKNVPANSSSQTVSNMPADQTKTEEVNLTLSSNKPSRNGYIFNGWQAQINGKAVDYQPGATLSYDVDDKDGSTIILKAQWTAWKHTVHYDKNVPANSSSQTVTNMPEDQTKTFDEKLNLSTKIPKREGYNFRGWLLEYGTAIAVVSPGTAYERDQNGGTYVLKAQWEPWKHTVHYDANGGDQSSVPNDQKKTYEQNMNVATKVPTRNEYKFLGWKAYHEYNDKSGNKHSELIGNYQPGASYNYDIDETGQYAADNGEYNKCGTVTMKAQWVQLYTVKYDGNQPAFKGVTVTGSVANQTQGQDESVNLRTNNFKNNSGIYKDWHI